MGLLIALVSSPGAARAEAPSVRVYKTATCGCCSKWVRHLEEHGFEVDAIDVANLGSVKRSNGVPPGLASCHTGLVGGYLIEGHVPASDVHRLLRERPAIAGIAVPGMPIGSPGMEGPDPETYRVFGFTSDGKISVFATHTP